MKNLTLKATTIILMSLWSSFSFALRSEACCFVAGTKVSTPSGLKNIEDIELQEIVTVYNLETKTFESAEVERLIKVAPQTIYCINDDIFVTADHPFLRDDHVWASINPQASVKYYGLNIHKLSVGDTVITDQGIRTIESIVRTERYDITYSLGVNHIGHNFIANGYVVHNKAGDEPEDRDTYTQTETVCSTNPPYPDVSGNKSFYRSVNTIACTPVYGWLATYPGPLSYTTSKGEYTTSYPDFAKHYINMYGLRSFDASSIKEAANVLYNSSRYQFVNEGKNETSYYYTPKADPRYATNGLTANSMGLDQAYYAKAQLLAYLSANNYNNLNFHYEQQVQLKNCSYDSGTMVWQCTNGTKARLILPFKLVRGQAPDELGTFLGAAIERDPESASTSAPKADGNHMSITHWAADPFVDFYISAGNRAQLAGYEANNEQAVYGQKTVQLYGGWMETGINGQNQTSDFITSNGIGNGASDYTNVLKETVPLVSNDDYSIIDIKDSSGIGVNSLQGYNKCFYGSNDPGCNNVSMNIASIMGKYNVTSLTVEERGRWVVNNIRAVQRVRNIDYDYCLSPIYTETANAYYDLRMDRFYKTFEKDTNGSINPKSNQSLNAFYTSLPEPVQYTANIKYERFKNLSEANEAPLYTDTFYSTNVLNTLTASLTWNNGPVQNYDELTDKQAYDQESFTTSGNAGTYKAWSCDESFADEVQQYVTNAGTCGTQSAVTTKAWASESGQCILNVTLGTGCANGTWTSTTSTSVNFGNSCSESCTTSGITTSGSCGWRETKTGRFYKESSAQ